IIAMNDQIVSSPKAATADQNSSLSSAEGDSPEILAARAKVADAEWWDRLTRRTSIGLAILYALVTALAVGASIWNNKTSSDLRRADQLLRELEERKAKV